MSVWLLGALLLGIIFVWFFRTVTRKSFLKGRNLKQLSEIYEDIQDQISKEVFNTVWAKVGEAFSIDPRFIDPNDTLTALSGIDSWDLGNGEDALSLWIEQEQLDRPPALSTVLDLAKWVQANGSDEL